MSSIVNNRVRSLETILITRNEMMNINTSLKFSGETYRTWSTIKRSMNWKTSSTPSELNAMVELSEDPWILQTL